MKYSKKALAFIGAALLLFQAGCSSPKQEEENWETVIECQYEDMGISPNQQFLIAKKDGLYGAYVKNGDSYELKIPFSMKKSCAIFILMTAYSAIILKRGYWIYMVKTEQSCKTPPFLPWKAIPEDWRKKGILFPMMKRNRDIFPRRESGYCTLFIRRLSLSKTGPL